MANPFVKKATAKKGKLALLREKQKKKVKAPEAPKFLGMEIVEPDLDELSTWERQKFKRLEKVGAASDKEDYTSEGLRFCHVREHDGFWSVDVVNGDVTIRFDNRAGSWMVHVDDKRIKEFPTLVFGVHNRWLLELKRQGRRTPYLMRDEVEKKPDKRDKGKTPPKEKAPRRNRATGPANAVKDPPPTKSGPVRAKDARPKWGPKSRKA